MRRKPQKVAREDSLGALFPEIASMWDTDTNEYTPFDYKPKSEASAHWVCKRCGNKFESKIGDLVAAVHKCPKCSRGYSSSFGEQLIFFACRQAFGENQVFCRDTDLLGFEIDISIPNKELAIEYGAWRWHKDRLTADKEKISRAQERGIVIYCIYDGCDDCSTEEKREASHAILLDDKATHEDFTALKKVICKILGETADAIDWQRAADDAKVAIHERHVPYERSFAALYPYAKTEWDYEKNFPLTPEDVFASSKQTYFFVCDKRAFLSR